QQSGEGWPLHRPADEAILISAHLSFLLSRPSPQLRLLTDCVQQPGGDPQADVCGLAHAWPRS
ncbi:MAG: hypothetical protein ACK5KS_10135, partial [Planctomyces sp.]